MGKFVFGDRVRYGNHAYGYVQDSNTTPVGFVRVRWDNGNGITCEPVSDLTLIPNDLSYHETEVKIARHMLDLAISNEQDAIVRVRLARNALKASIDRLDERRKNGR